jgi:hypothetical protein
MTQYLIHPDDAQKILNYLVVRPYNEVYPLINILSTMEKTECLDATGEEEE